MCFFIKNEKLLVKYKEVWSEVKKITKRKKFDDSPVFGDTCNKKEIKSFIKDDLESFSGDNFAEEDFEENS